MMTGRLFIDGNDAYSVYGVYVIEGGWNDLLSMPPLKETPTNDWQEEDGIEVGVATVPALDTREVVVKFAVDGVMDNYCGFISMLADNALHTFNCAEIGKTFRLRLVSVPNLDVARRLGFLSVRFADDYPLDGYDPYVAPTGGGVPTDDAYLLDSVPLTDYGVRVLDGSLSEIMKAPAVKIALCRNINSVAGAIYDTEGFVSFKAKDVKLKCLLRAADLSEMWRNYDALLCDLSQPEERVLSVKALGEEFPCLYKSCAVSEFSNVGRVWLTFTLTLTFTRDFRHEALANEEGLFIQTPEGDDIIV